MDKYILGPPLATTNSELEPRDNRLEPACRGHKLHLPARVGYRRYNEYCCSDYSFTVRKDTSGPVIIDSVNGYNAWLNQDPGQIWSAGFADTFSGLATAYYVINSGPALSGQYNAKHSAVWFCRRERKHLYRGLRPAGSTFSLLSEGTSYVTVTAFDSLGNQATYYDIFYIRKDTKLLPACRPVLFYRAQPAGHKPDKYQVL